MAATTAILELPCVVKGYLPIGSGSRRQSRVHPPQHEKFPDLPEIFKNNSKVVDKEPNKRGSRYIPYKRAIIANVWAQVFI
jgi:hypothetical protein